jgi:hypothetical protein
MLRAHSLQPAPLLCPVIIPKVIVAMPKAPANPSHDDNHSLIDELNAALASGGDEERRRILERIADLFAAGSRGYTGRQIALFDDVLQKLCADIEVKARARLARRLAPIGNAPPFLMRSLAFDDAIAVAQPILIHSPQLSDADLIENATRKSQEHLLAIAQRLKLSERVTDVLVERGDSRVIQKVAANTGARFSLAGYEKLTRRARRSRRLTLALARRSDLPRQYFLKLLETASASVRANSKPTIPKPSRSFATPSMRWRPAYTLRHRATRCQSMLQRAAVHRGERSCARPRTGIHPHRNRARQAWPLPGRSRGTRPHRQG